MSQRNKQIRAIVTADQIEAVNEIMLRNGYGPNYINGQVTAKTGTKVTHYALETLADTPEWAAIQLALKKVPKTKQTVEVERVDRRQKREQKLDALLEKKNLKMKKADAASASVSVRGRG